MTVADLGVRFAERVGLIDGEIACRPMSRGDPVPTGLSRQWRPAIALPVTIPRPA
jgi:hypothetical protein